MHVTPGAVSRQIRSLEETLGIRLLHRGHRQITLTGSGEDYYRAVTKAMVASRPRRFTLVAPSWFCDRIRFLTTGREVRKDDHFRVSKSLGDCSPATRAAAFVVRFRAGRIA
ncbi:MAG TPA: LysR family transcriptional regulator [Aromatoleum sp.]|uniref:LysR family transcriptional regulator n=1 Tax=Aromatoleum sp. TaxID=2307007 RepID=UPI002B462A49|nr:LysR family transcriptional regulator [Aromatoleum sp.]HJV27752.1 LysR family transcriptional regulator [Aromatoleum sp.]